MRLVLACLTACSFHAGDAPPGAGTGSDAPPGAGTGSDASLTPDSPKLHDSRAPDAEMGGDDAASSCNTAMCRAVTGSCNASGVCVITVTDDGNYTCPAGMACEIDCTTMTACTGTIGCGSASSCTIVCEMMNACEGGHVNCGSAGCLIECQASNTCMNDVVQCPGGCSLQCDEDDTCDGDNFGPIGATPDLYCCTDTARCANNSGVQPVAVSTCP